MTSESLTATSSNKYEEIFQIIVDEYNEKLAKGKNTKMLKFNYEDKLNRMYKRLVSKSCADDFESIFDAYCETIDKFRN